MNTRINFIRTLVADDSQDECMLLAAELRSIESIKLIGFVHDGTEAIHYLGGTAQFKNRETFPYPDLLLLDFNMPRCGGIEVLKFLQRRSHRPYVVLWSNTLEQVNIPLASNLGADMVCGKPAGKAELTKIIQRIETSVFGTESLLRSARKHPHVSANR